jgi:hypothetical protein
LEAKCTDVNVRTTPITRASGDEDPDGGLGGGSCGRADGLPGQKGPPAGTYAHLFMVFVEVVGRVAAAVGRRPSGDR